MSDSPPKRYKPPPVNDSPACQAAWNALIEEQGYPMTCVAKVCQGYFSAGWEAAQKAKKPSKKKTMPKG